MHLFHIVLHCVRFPFFCSPLGLPLVLITSIFSPPLDMLCLTHNYCLLEEWMMRDNRRFKKRSISKYNPALARFDEDAPCGKNFTEPTWLVDIFFFFQRDYVAHRYSTLLCLCKDVIKSVFSFPLKCLVSFLFTYFYITKNLPTQVSENPKSYFTPHTRETSGYNWPSYCSIQCDILYWSLPTET